MVWKPRNRLVWEHIKESISLNTRPFSPLPPTSNFVLSSFFYQYFIQNEHYEPNILKETSTDGTSVFVNWTNRYVKKRAGNFLLSDIWNASRCVIATIIIKQLWNFHPHVTTLGDCQNNSSSQETSHFQNVSPERVESFQYLGNCVPAPPLTHHYPSLFRLMGRVGAQWVTHWHRSKELILIPNLSPHFWQNIFTSFSVDDSRKSDKDMVKIKK